jgi:hypothetical protein
MTEGPRDVWGRILRKWGVDLAGLMLKLAGYAILILVIVFVAPGLEEQARRFEGWLRTGVWRPYPLREWLLSKWGVAPEVSWVIPQRIIDWFLDLPFLFGAIVFLLVVGVAFAIILAMFLAWAYPKERE